VAATVVANAGRRWMPVARCESTSSCALCHRQTDDKRKLFISSKRPLPPSAEAEAVVAAAAVAAAVAAAATTS